MPVWSASPAWVAGPRGTAISLDGEHDSLVADAPVPLRDDFTIGCWVNPARFQRSYANLLSSHNDDQGHNHRGVSLEQDGDNTNRFYLHCRQWTPVARHRRHYAIDSRTCGSTSPSSGAARD